MKRIRSLFLLIVLSLASCLMVFAAYYGDSIYYSVSEEEVTDSMRAFWRKAKKAYPGLVTIDPGEIDPSLPVIVINDFEELRSLIEGLDSARLYKGLPNSAERVNYYPSNPSSVWNKYPGLQIIDPNEVDTSLPVIEFENDAALDRFVSDAVKRGEL